MEIKSFERVVTPDPNPWKRHNLCLSSQGRTGKSILLNLKGNYKELKYRKYK